MSFLKDFFLNFKNAGYFFDATPVFPFKYLLPLLSFFGLILISGVILPIYINTKHRESPPYQNLSSRISISLIIFAALGYLNIFLRFEDIPYLGGRFVLYIIIISFFIWLIIFLKYYFEKFQKEKAEYQNKMQKAKYLKLPKKELKKWLNQKQ